VGLPFEFVIVNPDREDSSDNVRYVPYRASFAPGLFKARVLATAAALQTYDVLFLRYPTAIDLDPLAFLRAARPRVATVHHGKEVPEILSGGLRPGLIGRAALEWINGPRMLTRVAGIVGVTDEIRTYELQRANRNVPSRTIANGVDVEALPFTRFTPFDGRELNTVVVASTYGVAWHGIDRLIAALQAHAGPPRINLNLIGRDSGAAPGTEVQHRFATIRHHGELQGQPLDEVLKKSTLAFGTLALFRKGLIQACALKVREYVARGLPFVYAYEDVDLEPHLPFALRLPNDERPLPIPEIVAFAERVSSTTDLAEAMRTYAIRTLDWRVKLQAFYDFARLLA